MNRRASVWTMVFLLSAVLASSASAATCRKKITSFWGWEMGGGQTMCYVMILAPPPVLIGQIIRECDDSTWSWGRTDCANPTITYEDCDNCEARLQVEPPEDGVTPAGSSCDDAVVTEATPN